MTCTVLVQYTYVMSGVVPEQFKLVGKDVENDRFVAWVQRDVILSLTPGKNGLKPTPTRTTYKLVLYPNGWYAEGQYISTGEYRRFPEKKGVKLSCSKLDSALAGLANESLPLAV